MMVKHKGGACDYCKRKKCKCDRKLPSCGECVGTDSICTYSEGNKRGIPSGYIGLMEQRLSETEVLLYNVLSQLRALKPGAVSGSLGLPHGVNIPEPIPREVNMTKEARMQEWNAYPLKDPENVEQWRKFMTGNENVISDEAKEAPSPQQQHSEDLLMDQNLPPDRQHSTDPAFSHHDADMDINIATGLIGLSRSQASSNDPTHNPVAPIPSQPGFQVHLLGEAQNPSHEGVHVGESGMPQDVQNNAIDRAIDENMSNMRWEAAPPEIIRQQARPQDLVLSEQLASQLPHIYY